MGNSTTTIAISTDKTNYFSSDWITGTVFLIITAEHGVNINGINVKISGNEISIINKDNASEMLNWEFFCAQHSLSTINNNTPHGDGRGSCVLNAGYYEFPFQVRLPAGLPSTMCCKNEFTTPSDKVSKCEIKYEIKASLLVGRQQQPQHHQTTTQDESSCTIIVSSLPQHSHRIPTSPIICPPDTQQVSSCCCLNKGYMTIQASIDRDSIPPGDVLTVRYACRNASSVDLVGVTIECCEEWHWKTTTKRIRHSRVVGAVYVPKEDATEGEDGGGWEEDVALRIAPDARPSYEGMLLGIRHFVTVTLKTKLWITEPSLSMVVYVQQPPPPPPTRTTTTTLRRLSSVWEVHDAIVVSSSQTLNDLARTASENSVVQRLPSDWSARRAPVVEIPTAYAIDNVVSTASMEPICVSVVPSYGAV